MTGRVGLRGGVAAGAGAVLDGGLGKWNGGLVQGEVAPCAPDEDREGSAVVADAGFAADEGLGAVVVKTLDLVDGETSEKARLFLRFGEKSKAPTLEVFA